jgi:hypothetical protein
MLNVPNIIFHKKNPPLPCLVPIEQWLARAFTDKPFFCKDLILIGSFCFNGALISLNTLFNATGH